MGAAGSRRKGHGIRGSKGLWGDRGSRVWGAVVAQGVHGPQGLGGAMCVLGISPSPLRWDSQA